MLEIDGATKGSVEDVRELRNLVRVGHSGNYRVIVIDECHALSAAAWSAMLKQLEEPPPGVLYVLPTTEFHKIPETIKSRCLTLQYRSLSEDALVKTLKRACDGEGFAYEPEVLPLIARHARGGARNALMALEQLAIIGDISVERAKSLWPEDLSAFARDFVDTAVSGDVAAGTRAVWDTFNGVRNSQVMVDAVIERLRDVVLAGGRDGLNLKRVAAMMQAAWDLRIKLRYAPTEDVTLIEAMWFVFYHVASGGSAQTPTPARQAQVAAAFAQAAGVEAPKPEAKAAQPAPAKPSGLEFLRGL